MLKEVLNRELHIYIHIYLRSLDIENGRRWDNINLTHKKESKIKIES